LGGTLNAPTMRGGGGGDGSQPGCKGGKNKEGGGSKKSNKKEEVGTFLQVRKRMKRMRQIEKIILLAYRQRGDDLVKLITGEGLRGELSV